jgi:hypothetical protein
MKYIMLLASLLLSVTATPVKQRQAEATQATIKGFNAGTTPNGNGAL